MRRRHSASCWGLLFFFAQVKTNLSNAALASKMQPTTDMEKEVEMLLTAGGATEEAGLAEKEMEELKSKVRCPYRKSKTEPNFSTLETGLCLWKYNGGPCSDVLLVRPGTCTFLCFRR